MKHKFSIPFSIILFGFIFNLFSIDSHSLNTNKSYFYDFNSKKEDFEKYPTFMKYFSIGTSPLLLINTFGMGFRKNIYDFHSMDFSFNLKTAPLLILLKDKDNFFITTIKGSYFFYHNSPNYLGMGCEFGAINNYNGKIASIYADYIFYYGKEYITINNKKFLQYGVGLVPLMLSLNYPGKNFKQLAVNSTTFSITYGIGF